MVVVVVVAVAAAARIGFVRCVRLRDFRASTALANFSQHCCFKAGGHAELV